ncbi:UPF0182 family membrane protein [Alkaliphilus transvaalensis]|uniref:UPF0182 family membrane protein n=1 Tax=Alkaliphilus transvaalensis TaxID=114628 RepID=UPI00047AE2FD|nr:UPF0182 family protein [Alkaliphilus transvaalensis]
MKRKNKVLVGVGITLFLGIVVFFDQLVNFIVDYQWFSELGYEDVFLKKLVTQAQIGIPLFVIGSLLLYGYFQSLKKSYYNKVESYHMGISEKSLNKIILLPALTLGFIVAITTASRLWFDILIFRNGEAFNVVDPIFNKDISFYLFNLPLFREILALIMGLLFLVIITTFIFYILMFTLRRPTLYEVEGRFVFKNELINNVIKMALKQLTMVGAVFFLVLAVNYYLSAYNILYYRGADRGVLFGASYTDIAVSLKVLRIQLIISILAIGSIIYAYNRKKVKVAVLAPVLLIAISIIGNLVGASVENFIVVPNQRARQLPYIENNITYTRMAYGLDTVTTKELNVSGSLTIEDINENREVINNIRINDYRPTLQAYNQTQATRFYYLFNDVDIDRYYINGEYTQVFLAARELDIEQLDSNAKNWINQHLKYTHGYGLTLSPVNKVTRDGQPHLAIRDIPPVSNIDIEITRPEIYFGELTNQYIIVNTKEMEFDYPLDVDNAETMYEGTAGISLGGLNRLLHSYKQGTTKLFLSGSVTSESRIILHRNILERVEKIAPFIEYDEDPYIVINDGKLFWIIDGYTTSNSYPYATPFRRDGVNYIRNSVKIVIDAYNGEVDYYVSDDTDPVINTYNKIFPQLFKSLEEMPEGLIKHLRYPQDLFDLQSEVFAIYHMTNPNVFYNQEDVWYLAEEKYHNRQQQVESQYMMMKLPGEEEVEYVLSVPYTPRNLPNMTALFMARNDGEHYGELVVYRLPKGQNIAGPAQIEARIDSDTTISQNLSLWGEGGSEVIRGNLLVIPVENSLLYVEPLYIAASTGNTIPEVKKVIVAYKDQIVMEDTLDLALVRIFGEGKSIGEEQIPELDENEDEDIIEIIQPLKELIQQTTDTYSKAKEASQRGDWAGYGRYLEELERLLNRLNNESQKIED